MKLIAISGTRGSGKTTLIRELVDRLWAIGNHSAVIVNEEGKEDYDSTFIENHELVVDRLRGG
jgi:G3E family GTPase